MKAFDTFWHMDTQKFHAINDALMIMIPKTTKAATIKDYRPISSIHVVGNLFSKPLANRLTPKMEMIVDPIQSTFMKGRFIQDNFRFVQASATLLHAWRMPSLLLKVDTTRAFDSVVWPFLMEIMRFMGFLTYG
jgi:hypothetical protein